MSNKDRAEGKKDQAVGSVKETVVRADLLFFLLFALFFSSSFSGFTTSHRDLSLGPRHRKREHGGRGQVAERQRKYVGLFRSFLFFFF